MKPLVDYKVAIGPVSKNVVDACIDFANSRDVSLMLIPSRRQVEWNGGYSNGWTTETFARYVRERTDKILLMRDHAGPNQGEFADDGYESLACDCRNFDLIHLDPWKSVSNFEDGCVATRHLLMGCYTQNANIRYEIGTEQSICAYEANRLDSFIRYLEAWVLPEIFDRIRFAVIQSGTSLKGNTNTGEFDPVRLSDMLAVCRWNGLLSKVHNGDYLPIDLIRQKFIAGLNTINIAPEFGQIETQTYLAEMNDEQFERYYEICRDSGRWVKWLDTGKPLDKKELVNVSGHYVISTPAFQAIKRDLRVDIDEMVKSNLIRKLEVLHASTCRP